MSKTDEDKLFELADQAWEQYEFNGRYSNQINMDNYDAVRHAFMQGYILGYTNEDHQAIPKAEQA